MLTISTSVSKQPQAWLYEPYAASKLVQKVAEQRALTDSGQARQNATLLAEENYGEALPHIQKEKRPHQAQDGILEKLP